MEQPPGALLGPYYSSCDEDNEGGPNWQYATPEILAEYNQAIREAAWRNDCLFVDVCAVQDGVHWTVHEDGVHANDLGHLLIANSIFQVLATNCSGLALETKNLERSGIPPWRDESVLKRTTEFGSNGSAR